MIGAQMDRQRPISVISIAALAAAAFTVTAVAYPQKAATTEPAGINFAQKYKHIDAKTGYRMGYYRAAVPQQVPGAKRIGLNDVRSLRKDPAVLLLDVMAHTGAGYDPISGQWRIAKPRHNIPGSIWLPDVGAGHLTPQLTKYFRSNLRKFSGGKLDRKIIIYCTADCWMSWNAAKRAAGWGYSNILWFAEGSDDWQQAGLALALAKPVPVDLIE